MSEKRHASLGIHGTELHHPHRGPILKRARFISIAVLVLLVLGAVATLVLRAVHAHALAESTADQGKVYVTTINAKPVGNSEKLTLPATLQGVVESTIYARSSGYVLRWNKDIGSRVAKGDVLAEIDTPEIDQQLSQAIAAQQQAAASLDLARTSAERWEALRKKDAVTQQELNERTSAYTQAKANLAAADANVRRLQKLGDFKKVTAPFAGIVTRRNIEVGDLVDAGNGGIARALFTIAQVDPLRVYVYAPQAYAQRIKIGDVVGVTQGDAVGQVFHGTVVRTAGAIDPATRTLQIEITLPNSDNKLLAGSYAQIVLPVNGTSNALTVPSNVILFRPEGTRVAVVDAGGVIKFHTVTIGHDLGNALEILDGIRTDDKLVLNPADSLADNDVVTIVQPKPAADTRKAAP